MGLFDKLKKKALGQEENSAQAVTNEPANAPEIPSAPQQAPAMPTSKFEKEDFSGLSDLQILEKIDQYANEFQKTPNKMVLAKLSAAVDEFDQRVCSMPLSKKGTIAQEWSCLKGIRDQIAGTIHLPTNLPTIAAGQIGGWVAKIYAELCK